MSRKAELEQALDDLERAFARKEIPVGRYYSQRDNLRQRLSRVSGPTRSDVTLSNATTKLDDLLTQLDDLEAKYENKEIAHGPYSRQKATLKNRIDAARKSGSTALADPYAGKVRTKSEIQGFIDKANAELKKRGTTAARKAELRKRVETLTKALKDAPDKAPKPPAQKISAKKAAAADIAKDPQFKTPEPEVAPEPEKPKGKGVKKGAPPRYTSADVDRIVRSDGSVDTELLRKIANADKGTGRLIPPEKVTELQKRAKAVNKKILEEHRVRAKTMLESGEGIRGDTLTTRDFRSGTRVHVAPSIRDDSMSTLRGYRRANNKLSRAPLTAGEEETVVRRYRRMDAQRVLTGQSRRVPGPIQVRSTGEGVTVESAPRKATPAAPRKTTRAGRVASANPNIHPDLQANAGRVVSPAKAPKAAAPATPPPPPEAPAAPVKATRAPKKAAAKKAAPKKAAPKKTVAPKKVAAPVEPPAPPKPKRAPRKSTATPKKAAAPKVAGKTAADYAAQLERSRAARKAIERQGQLRVVRQRAADAEAARQAEDARRNRYADRPKRDPKKVTRPDAATKSKIKKGADKAELDSVRRTQQDIKDAAARKVARLEAAGKVDKSLVRGARAASAARSSNADKLLRAAKVAGKVGRVAGRLAGPLGAASLAYDLYSVKDYAVPASQSFAAKSKRSAAKRTADFDRMMAKRAGKVARPSGAAPAVKRPAPVSSVDGSVRGRGTGGAMKKAVKPPQKPVTRPTPPKSKPVVRGPQKPATARLGASTRVVKRGDTLWGIAKDSKTTVSAILKANPTIAERRKRGETSIFSGTKVRIPKGGK